MKKINNKKAQMGTAVIVGLVFAIILVVVGITIATNLNTTATTRLTGNQTIGSIVNDTDYNVTLTPVEQGIVLSTLNLTNGSYNYASGNYSITTTGSLDIHDNGTLTITNVYATWTYSPFGYVTGVTSTMILLIPLFLGLAALGIAALFVTKRV